MQREKKILRWYITTYSVSKYTKVTYTTMSQRNIWSAADTGDLNFIKHHMTHADLYTAHMGVLPLYAAIYKGHYDCVVHMLHHMGAMDTISSDGMTPIRVAFLGNQPCAQYILDKMTVEDMRQCALMYPDMSAWLSEQARQRIRTLQVLPQLEQLTVADTIQEIRQYIHNP